MNDDQASKLRRYVAQGKTGRHAKVVAVASGKGGVGKTVVAVNLAICLAGRGRRVVLFDADLGLANAEVLMNAEPSCSVIDVLSGRKTMRQAVVDVDGGIGLVSGGSGMAKLANLSEFERARLLDALEDLEAEADIIVVDCGAGISPTVLAFAASADMTLVVTSPEPTAMTDAYAFIKATMQRYDDSWQPRLLVNFASNRSEARDVYQRISRVSWRFLKMSVEDGGYILRDEAMARAVKQRVPVAIRWPRSAAARCLYAGAKQIDKALIPTAKPEGFFRRVMSLFM